MNRFLHKLGDAVVSVASAADAVDITGSVVAASSMVAWDSLDDSCCLVVAVSILEVSSTATSVFVVAPCSVDDTGTAETVGYSIC